MYPTATILLAQTKTVHFFRSQTSLLQMTKPAVRLIQSEIGAEASLLAHALSNGGSGHLTCIARQHHAVTGRPLPINALILDSTPTKPDFRSLFVSLSIPLPPSLFVRLPLQTLIGVLLFFSYVLPRWMGMTNMGDRVYDDLKNTEMTADGSGGTREWLRHKAPRTYIYSDTDDICPAYSIEAHFQQALRRGLNVRREMWSGSGHVAHMKADPERYWSVVRRAWEES
jgi:hypothetical protein